MEAILRRDELPFSKLFELGGAQEIRDWSVYEQFGFSAAHVPQLCTVLADDRLHQSEQDNDDVWAPVHAWRILGRLRAVEAVLPALKVLTDYCESDDFVSLELPQVFALIGAPALPHLVAYLADKGQPTLGRMTVAEALAMMGHEHTDQRQACIDSLHSELQQHSTNDPMVNAFLVESLVELGAVDSLALIREAYQSGVVDSQMFGDLEDVEVELGVREARLTPLERYMHLADLDYFMNTLMVPAGEGGDDAFIMEDDIGIDFIDVDGIEEAIALPPRSRDEKISRNEPCPCGSGKKYKKCCLGK